MKSSKAFKIKSSFLLVIAAPLLNTTVVLFSSPCEAGATLPTGQIKKYKAQWLSSSTSHGGECGKTQTHVCLSTSSPVSYPRPTPLFL